jgi:4-hydroxy-3-methylbut-2-enyl diphosphate reductase
MLLVVGASNSSNSNRLQEIGSETGVATHLIEDPKAFDPAWLEGVATLGITAGASTPEELVQEVIDRLRTCRKVRLESSKGEDENVQFKLPPQLSESVLAQRA